MPRLLVFFIVVADIVAILDCLKSRWDESRKIVWILVIVFFPILGVALYYLLRRK